MVESQLICEESEMQEKSKVTMKIVTTEFLILVLLLLKNVVSGFIIKKKMPFNCIKNQLTSNQNLQSKKTSYCFPIHLDKDYIKYFQFRIDDRRKRHKYFTLLYIKKIENNILIY